jgi:catechol 2,3-dioxygenase-like lactoylglutathione lyase family enzyme
MNYTHLALYVQNIDATRHFYIDNLGCIVRRFSSEEKFLSISIGDFIINFDGSCSGLAGGYNQGVAHLGFELETRTMVDSYAEHFRLSDSFDDRRNVAHGPYRFYVQDPDGYTIEIHTWDGIEE